MPSDARKTRSLIAAVCRALIAIPFLTVRFPPIADLPQHVAQVRLSLEAVRDPTSPYQIQWFTPYSLVYTVLGLLWTGAVHLLAAERGRAVEPAVLVSLLFFGHMMYWGFYSFAMGRPVFALWFLLTTWRRHEPFRWSDALLFLGTAVLLYMSHVLWFAAGLVWLAVSTLAFRVPLRTALLRAASVAAMVVGALVWYGRFVSSTFAKPPSWYDAPLVRLTYSWYTEAAFGGVRGTAEYVIAGVLLGWALLALWQSRKSLTAATDRKLLLAGVMLFTCSLLLPNAYENTLFFAERWAPFVVILGLLALPVPDLKPVLLRTAVMGVLAAFCVPTAFVWIAYERRETDGLGHALYALPERPRVLGLDFVRESDLVKGRPFLQGFACAQVLRGGRLNSSFASFTPSLVVLKNYQEPVPWTNGMEWLPETVKLPDFAYVDFIIVNGTDDVHRHFAQQSQLAPVTDAGNWRLYRVAGSG